MFERYTERSRRVIFFARYEASQWGDTSIETSHLLLGLIREDENLLFVSLKGAPAENLRLAVNATLTAKPKITVSMDLPLSVECKRILGHAVTVSESLGDREISTEHLLLGILREQTCAAARVLAAFNVQPDAIHAFKPRGISVPIAWGQLAFDSRKLIEALADLRWEFLTDHFSKASTAGAAGNWVAARAELQEFFESLVSAIRANPNAADTLTPVIEGLDWQFLRHTRTGLGDAEDWGFRYWLTGLVANLLLTRYQMRREG
jgi:hypothetical protein